MEIKKDTKKTFGTPFALIQGQAKRNPITPCGPVATASFLLAWRAGFSS